LAEKQKYFVFGLAKNFKIQLKIMRALWQIGAGFFDAAFATAAAALLIFANFFSSFSHKVLQSCC